MDKVSLSLSCLALAGALFLVSCASENPAPADTKAVAPEPPAYVAITNALNRQDWATLRQFAKPGMRANEYIATWEASAKAGYPPRAGKLIEFDMPGQVKKDETVYTFEYQPNADGSPNPHLFQVVVRNHNGHSELVDFWNFGW